MDLRQLLIDESQSRSKSLFPTPLVNRHNAFAAKNLLYFTYYYLQIYKANNWKSRGNNHTKKRDLNL